MNLFQATRRWQLDAEHLNVRHLEADAVFVIKASGSSRCHKTQSWKPKAEIIDAYSPDTISELRRSMGCNTGKPTLSVVTSVVKRHTQDSIYRKRESGIRRRIFRRRHEIPSIAINFGINVQGSRNSFF